MNVIILLLNGVLIFYLASRLNRKNPALRKVFWLGLAVKIAAGILVGVIYSYYYEAGDTFYFFNDGVILAKYARMDFMTYLKFLWCGDDSFSVWQGLTFKTPRALFFTKIVSLANLVTADNYWMTSAYFSLISFYFSWKLVVRLIRYFPAYQTAALFSFLFFPSVVFWGSGVLKESIALASICFIAYGFIVLWMKDRLPVMEWILLAMSIWILWTLKYYYAAILIPVLCTSFLMRFVLIPLFRIDRPLIQVGSWLFVFLMPLFLMTFVRSNFHIDNFFTLVVKSYEGFLELSRPGGAIHYDNLASNGLSFIVNAPWALFSGLFRPFISESTNIFQAMISVENLVIFILMVTALRNLKEGWLSPNRLLIVSILVYSSLLCVFLALSVPNFGSLSRYRIGFLPFLVFLTTCGNQFFQRFADYLQRGVLNLVR
jgi:hypothetical protein